MSLIKQILAPELKFTPASTEVDWTRINTLVHGPGAGDDKRTYNSAVFACLMAISTSYVEPPLTVYRKMQDGEKEALPEHPLQGLLDMPTPNGELSIDELRFWIAWAKNIDGNAYLMKVRSGNETRGNVVELWPVSPTRIEPVTTRNSGDWISYYKYRFAPNQIIAVPVENIIHFRLGIDDQDMRRGLAPLKALVREMSTDDEAQKFVSALLKNYAVPGLVAMPAAGNHMTEDDADRLTDKLRMKFGSDNRGNIAVISKESKIEQFGFSPEELDMTVLHRIPEERISAVMGIPAILAGLGAGLDRATYSNASELREFFTESKLVPSWNMDAQKYNVSLVPDFTNDKNIYVAHDLGDVRALQEDEDRKYSRLSVAVGGKSFMHVNEARAAIGLDPDDELGDENIEPEDSATGVPPDEQNKLAADMERWHRKALKAFRNNDRGKLLEDFALSEIPEHNRIMIMEMLEMAQSTNDIDRIFNFQNGHGQRAYP